MSINEHFKKLINFSLPADKIKSVSKRYGTFPNLLGIDCYEDWGDPDNVEKILMEEEIRSEMDRTLQRIKLKKEKINYEFQELTKAEEKELYNYWMRRNNQLPPIQHPWEDKVPIEEIVKCWTPEPEPTLEIVFPYEKPKAKLESVKKEKLPAVKKMMIVYFDQDCPLDKWKEMNPVLSQLPEDVGILYVPVTQDQVRVEFMNLGV